ncbi:hypothetical protein NEIELOOT_02514 [Neisseria elongata subsp. glycolytica ATCC 29315]|uniref:Uncharacterized protein n=1 Tax=Neisseria elongata subsp. glycolytica ATCC 29315 TaxID=546263 RepID=D4DTV8_NEIEG|nr:hypothetical protein NEIELOOT_02514 [Neisseria elongata subsp. glycolytica ATCC 29315]
MCRRLCGVTAIVVLRLRFNSAETPLSDGSFVLAPQKLRFLTEASFSDGLLSSTIPCLCCKETICIL